MGHTRTLDHGHRSLAPRLSASRDPRPNHPDETGQETSKRRSYNREICSRTSAFSDTGDCAKEYWTTIWYVIPVSLNELPNEDFSVFQPCCSSNQLSWVRPFGWHFRTASFSKCRSVVQGNANLTFSILQLLLRGVPYCLRGTGRIISVHYSCERLCLISFPLLSQNHFDFQLGGLPFISITLGMVICVATTDKLTRMSRHVKLPFIDPPGVGTPAEAPEAGLKVVLIAWYVLSHSIVKTFNYSLILNSILMPVSLFWFAWCVVPMMSFQDAH